MNLPWLKPREVQKALCPEDLLLLAKADSLGRDVVQDYSSSEAFLNDRLHDYKELMKKPQVTGKDLIALGYKPGPKFSELLAYTHKLHLSGVSHSNAIAQVKSFEKTL